MATTETKKIDSIIASRRAILMGGGALAALAVAGTGVANAAIPAAPTEAEVLNFALNLEYLEAQFYTLATEGVTADKSTLTVADPANAGGTLKANPITTGTKPGTVTVKANAKVPFAIPAIQAYAVETAREERNHVNFLRGALSTAAVDQPAIDLQNSFAALGALIGAPGFDPFASDAAFLLGAFIFEDVGVTAYHGGAQYLSKATLTAGVGIHAVEAYHAGLVRYSIYALDAQNGSATPGSGPLAQTATKIANLRAVLDGTSGTLPTDSVGLTGQDDFGLTTINVPLNNSGNNAATTIMDAGKLTTAGNTSSVTFNYYIGFARTLAQVLNIVYADATGKQVKGGFFPNGLNGDIN